MTRRSLQGLIGVFAAVVAVVGVAGCGAPTAGLAAPSGTAATGITGAAAPISSSSSSFASPAPTAAEILRRAAKQANDARSVHVVADLRAGDEGHVRADVRGTRDDRFVDATVTRGGGLGSYRIISVPEGYFVRGDETFWARRAAPVSVQRAGQTFVRMPPGPERPPLAYTMGSILTQALADIDRLGAQAGLRAEVVDGVPSWVLEHGGVRVWVRQDTLDLSGYEADGPDVHVRMEFSQWGRDPGIVAPPSSEVMEMP